MNNVIIFAHPNPKSFGKGIVDAAVKASEDAGATVKVRDLYAMNFESILTASDFETFHKGKVPEDIAVEQGHIRWAHVITFVYPVWWTSMPAMLKGYIDRVFSYGFAYEYNNGNAKGLLGDKKILLFSTTGSSTEEYEKNGILNSMKQTVDQGIFKFSGITDINHTFFGAVPYVDDETRKGYLKEVQNIVKNSLEVREKNQLIF